ncbi:hypothetical protein [Streptomyces sp. NPDC007172]|uniref:hypothetical protein n=1 Tax=Streptomyces sp. NPDC007172 TaxID=3364776 RepID=UPI00368D1CAF
MLSDGLLDVVTGWQFAAAVMAASLAVGLPVAAYAGHHTGSPGPGVLLIIVGAGLSIGVPWIVGAKNETGLGLLGGAAAGLVLGAGISVVMAMRWARAA